MNYIAIIHKDSDSDFGVTFPDVHGCFSAGSTMDEAQAMAKEALEGHLEILLEKGHSLPKPSSLDTIMNTPDYADGAAIIVPYNPTHEYAIKRVNINVREDKLTEIDNFAKSIGMNRSAFLVDSAMNALHQGGDVA